MTGSSSPARRNAPAGGAGGIKAASGAAAKELPDLTALRAAYPHLPALPPTAAPSFKAGDVAKAIPPHCFERKTLTSLWHTAKDIAIAAAIAYAGSYIPGLPLAARVVLWPVYWYALGCVLTGLWVIAHECGHQAFSPSIVVNDSVGFVLHSALLVPYWSWKYSHSQHHKNTNSCENDEVFVPPTRREVAAEMFHDTPLGNAISIFLMLTVGW
jgi:omega-6 fatty acid desaturase (delta-12 desaturase)